MRRIAAGLAFALSVLLSGCFVSDKPMFTPASAVRPLEAGRYALFERYSEPDKPSEYMDVRLRADGVYDFVNEQGAVNPVTFHPIAGGFYVAQAGDIPLTGTDRKGYGYALFKVSGREALVYVVECLKQDKPKIAALGVEFRGQYECAIDGVAEPTRLFEALERNSLPSRMVRE
jgi:hypothetical protein